MAKGRGEEEGWDDESVQCQQLWPRSHQCIVLHEALVWKSHILFSGELMYVRATLPGTAEKSIARWK